MEQHGAVLLSTTAQQGCLHMAGARLMSLLQHHSLQGHQVQYVLNARHWRAAVRAAPACLVGGSGQLQRLSGVCNGRQRMAQQTEALHIPLAFRHA